MKNLNIINQNTKITNIIGAHYIEGYTSKQVTKVIVDGPNMKYLPNNFHKLFPSMTKVEIKSSNLKKLTKYIGENLEWISITGNSIDEINKDTFVESPALKHIEMSNNKITHLPTDLFDSNTELEYVSIERNEMSTLQMSLFAYMTELREFRGGYNNFTRVDWAHMTSEIQLIDLTGNKCIDSKYTPDDKEAFMESINGACGAETKLVCSFIKRGGG